MLHAHLLLPLVFQCALPLVLAPQGLAFGFVLLRVESLAEEGKVRGSQAALGTLSDGRRASGQQTSSAGWPPAQPAHRQCRAAAASNRGVAVLLSCVASYSGSTLAATWQQLRAIASNLQAADAAAALPPPPAAADLSGLPVPTYQFFRQP